MLRDLVIFYLFTAVTAAVSGLSIELMLCILTFIMIVYS